MYMWMFVLGVYVWKWCVVVIWEIKRLHMMVVETMWYRDYILLMLIKCACFPLCLCYGWISHPFLVVVFMVSVPVGYRYLGRGDLVAGRFEAHDGNYLPSILF